VRQRYRLHGKLVIGFVGWFRMWHGLEMLLEIFKELSLGQSDISLMLVGDGPAASNLRYYAQKNYLFDQVIFTGPVARDEIPAHIAAMDIAVQPSSPEYACPMKLIEYMAMGKCIVAPDQSNIREIIDNGLTGFLFRANDKESLRAVLQELINHPNKRKVVGRSAYGGVFERGFLWDVNAKKTLSLVVENRQ